MVKLVESMKDNHAAKPSLVISNKPNVGGLEKARALGVKVKTIVSSGFESRVEFENNLQKSLLSHEIDIICLAGFMRILTVDFTAKWEGCMLNIHPSLLPKYKGLNTHQRAIDAGDEKAGCTVHLVTADLDDGPILGQSEVPVFPNDTADILAARVLVQEHQLYPNVFRAYAKSLQAQKVNG